jgi:hypothetical protein
MGAILHNAVKAFDPMFVLRVMEETKKRGVKPDAKFVLQIEEFRQKVKKGLVSQVSLKVNGWPSWHVFI